MTCIHVGGCRRECCHWQRVCVCVCVCVSVWGYSTNRYLSAEHVCVAVWGYSTNRYLSAEHVCRVVWGYSTNRYLSAVRVLAVWGYSTVAVFVISLAGLLGVAVIPIMQKVFYNHLLQFLVAVAVGALSGDALLHLLPHVSWLAISIFSPVGLLSS